MRLVCSLILAVPLVLSTLVAPPAGPLDMAQYESEDRGKKDGRRIFRHDTFGDEQLWTDVLRMHDVVATLPPATALAVGLKVDAEALPAGLIAALRAGKVDLTSPAVTVELLRLNAVVGSEARSAPRASSPASASRAPSATPRSTTPLRRVSAGGWTDGRTPT